MDFPQTKSQNVQIGQEHLHSRNAMTNLWNTGVGVPSLRCQISISACIGQYLSVYCSSVPSSHLSSHSFKSLFRSDIDHNDHYYHDAYSEMPRLSLVDKGRAIGQIQTGFTIKRMVEFVSGVGQENVLLV